MTNTEQLTESLERLEQMRLAFKTGNVAALDGVHGVIGELLKVLRILTTERETWLAYMNHLAEQRTAYAVDKAASEIPALKRFSAKRDAKGKDEGRTSRESVNGASPQR